MSLFVMTCQSTYSCMQLKSNRAFQLALRARSSLDQALDDVIDEGLKKRSAAALQTIASAYTGAKGAVMVTGLPMHSEVPSRL